jgi:competence protein ComEA
MRTSPDTTADKAGPGPESPTFIEEPIMILRTLIAAVLTTLSLAAAAAVDVNKASEAELQALPGIGPALSTRIVAERQKSPFKSWGDMIERVRGVGPGSALKLSGAGLTVSNAAYAPTAQEPAKPAPAARPGTGK